MFSTFCDIFRTIATSITYHFEHSLYKHCNQCFILSHLECKIIESPFLEEIKVYNWIYGFHKVTRLLLRDRTRNPVHIFLTTKPKSCPLCYMHFFLNSLFFKCVNSMCIFNVFKHEKQLSPFFKRRNANI